MLQFEILLKKYLSSNLGQNPFRRGKKNLGQNAKVETSAQAENMETGSSRYIYIYVCVFTLITYVFACLLNSLYFVRIPVIENI